MTTKRCLTVTELVRELNTTLETQLPTVAFEGEITGLSSRGASGHVYFQVKDEQSHISAVIWRSVAQKLDFPLTEGLFVQCFGVPKIYNVTGKLQIDVKRMVPAGEGLLRKKFLELRAKLDAEGIFAAERKRTLPFLPRAIGVVTSESGAVIHDIMVRIRERMPGLIVYLASVKVQGDGAAREIADGIRRFNEQGEVEVIIVARGGGSLQDLWAFNEEEVVRAIFASKIPVISGVGHETDVTLADYVADVRAPTPTAAAEMVVPRRADLLERLIQIENRLNDFSRWFNPYEQRLDELSAILKERVVGVFERARLVVEAALSKLARIHPEKVFLQYKTRLDTSALKLSNLAGNTVERYNQRLETLSMRLNSVNPENVVKRGYAIVRQGKKVVQDVVEIEKGEALLLSMRDGTVDVQVTDGIKKSKSFKKGVAKDGEPSWTD